MAIWRNGEKLSKPAGPSVAELHHVVCKYVLLTLKKHGVP